MVSNEIKNQRRWEKRNATAAASAAPATNQQIPETQTASTPAQPDISSQDGSTPSHPATAAVDEQLPLGTQPTAASLPLRPVQSATAADTTQQSTTAPPPLAQPTEPTPAPVSPSSLVSVSPTESTSTDPTFTDLLALVADLRVQVANLQAQIPAASNAAGSSQQTQVPDQSSDLPANHAPNVVFTSTNEESGATEPSTSTPTGEQNAHAASNVAFHPFSGDVPSSQGSVLPTSQSLITTSTPHPVLPLVALMNPAPQEFEARFPYGVELLTTPPNGFLCGLHALIRSVEAQHPSVTPPTLRELTDIVKSVQYHSVMPAGFQDTNFFHAEQLQHIIDTWFHRHDRRAQLGFLRIEDGVEVPYLLPQQRRTRVWIHLAYDHWSGLAPQTRNGFDSRSRQTQGSTNTTIDQSAQPQGWLNQVAQTAASTILTGVVQAVAEHIVFTKPPTITKAGNSTSDTLAKVSKVDLIVPNKGKPFALQDYSDDFEGNALLANHFRVTTGKHTDLYQYDLTFLRRETQRDRDHDDELKEAGEPPLGRVDVGGVLFLDVDPARPKRKRIVWLLMERLMAANPQTCFATDYFEQVICTTRLSGSTDSWYKHFIYYDEHETQPAIGADVFLVDIAVPMKMSLDDLRRSLVRTPVSGVEDYEKQPIIRALNTIFSYRPYQKCFQVPNQRPANSNGAHEMSLTTKTGNKFFGIARAVPLPSAPADTGLAATIRKGRGTEPGIVTITGFARSFRTSVSLDGLLTLNINPATSVFYQHANTLQDLIDLWLQNNYFDGRWHTVPLNIFLKNINVRTNYRPTVQGQQARQGYVNFIGRVTGLANPINHHRDPTPSNVKMVAPRLAQNMTVQSYFQRPQNACELVVILGQGRDRHTFPANLLNVIPGQLNRNTDVKPAAGIRTPIENRNLMTSRARGLFLGASADEGGARQFDLNLSADLLRVPLSRLNLPAVYYRNAAYTAPGNAPHGQGGHGRGSSRGGRSQPSNRPEPEFIIADVDVNASRDVVSKPFKLGSWNMSNKFYVVSAGGFRWTYVELRLSGRDGCTVGNVAAFETRFRGCMLRVGMNNMTFVDLNLSPGPDSGPGPTHVCELPARDFPSYKDYDGLFDQDESLRKRLRQLKADYNVHAVILFLPEPNKDLYCAIKRLGDQEIGITTICHVTNKKGSPEINTTPDFCANLTMKLNLKVSRRTANQALLPARKGPILNQSTMILGIDVTHPGGQALKSSPSVAAVVGSVDAFYAQWPASLASQLPRPKPGRNPQGRKEALEEVEDLANMVQERLSVFFDRNKIMPLQIVVYRDGLSEEQFKMCKNDEYPRIREGVERAKSRLRDQCTNAPQETIDNINKQVAIEPKILIICAVKRHNTRCYPEQGQSPDTSRFVGLKGNDPRFNFNPLPGTLITERITYGTGRDFFLYSQNAIQGTARPTHYVILVDEISCSSQDVAQMTHNLSYLFGRATRSTGVCAPVYYADLAAERARCYVRDVYHRHVAPGEDRVEFEAGVHNINLRIHQSLQNSMYYI